jgi:hypothetical protein
MRHAPIPAAVTNLLQETSAANGALVWFGHADWYLSRDPALIEVPAASIYHADAFSK